MLAGPGTSATSPAALQALLPCPACGAEVSLETGEALCAAGSHRYPVVEGIPILVDEETLQADPQYAGHDSDRVLRVCCSAEKLPLASASFESAIAIAVIEHVPDGSGSMQLSMVFTRA
ncbi:MAG TPA: hypothetical protein VIM33_05995 [Gaiellaceae bacterium]|jgi:uncharacterized protein YbaR (Trm112 family)